MFNRFKNVLSIIRLAFFIRHPAIAKKWLIAAIFGVYIFLPSLAECTPPPTPHLSVEAPHSNALVGIIFHEDVLGDLTDGETRVLMYGSNNTFKDVSEDVCGIIKFSPHVSVFGKQMISKGTEQSSKDSEYKTVQESRWTHIILVLLGMFGVIAGSVSYHFTVDRNYR